MVEHAFLTLGKQRQVDLGEFEGRMVYRVSNQGCYTKETSHKKITNKIK